MDHTVNVASLTGTLSGCFSLIFVASAARTSVKSDRERVIVDYLHHTALESSARVSAKGAPLLTERLCFLILPLHD